MSSVFSKIGSAFSKSPLGFIGTGVSALSNFLGNRQRNKYLQDQINYQKFLRSLSTDPAKMSAYIHGFERPLDQGLVSGVNNQVQAFGAERGLSTSPQIMSEIEAQALGPLQQRQQEMAINEAMTSLGMPASTPNFDPSQPFDITSIMKNLLGGGKSAPATIGQGPSMIDTSGLDAGGDVPTPSLDVPGGFDLSSLIPAFIGD